MRLCSSVFKRTTSVRTAPRVPQRTPLTDNPGGRRPRHKLMDIITIRVDDDIADQLRQVAAEERETITSIVRRYVRRGLKADGREIDSPRVHEGTGRVR